MQKGANIFMNFLYSKKVENLLKKQVQNSLVGVISCLIVPFFLFFLWFENLKEEHYLLLVFVFVLFLGLAIFEFVRTLRCTKVQRNLIQCSLVVDQDKISGFTSLNMEIANSVNYFEIKILDIRDVGTASPEVTVQKQYATLLVHHMNGTIKIPIENEVSAMEIIKDKMNSVTI